MVSEREKVRRAAEREGVTLEEKLAEEAHAEAERVAAEARARADEKAVEYAARKEAKKKREEEEQRERRARLVAKKEAAARKMSKKKTESSARRGTDEIARMTENIPRQAPSASFEVGNEKIWYRLGPTVATYMFIPKSTTILGLKAYILESRKDYDYIGGITDCRKLEVYPQGSRGMGDPLTEEMIVPDGTTESDPFPVRCMHT